MKKRQWSSNEKFKIVMEGLSEKIEISKLYTKYQISQSELESIKEIWPIFYTYS